MKHNSKTLVTVLCAAAILAVSALAEEPSRPRAKDSQTDIDFYGKLVDQDDNPVGGAKIVYVIEKYGLLFPTQSKKTVRTKNDGTFTIRGGNAARLKIRDAELKGYEYRWQDNESLFEYRSFYNSELRHEPDKEHPVILHIRRREAECCIILTASLALEFSETQKENCIGYNPFTFHTSERHPDDYKQGEWEMEFTAANDKAASRWLLTIKINGETAGVQQSEKKSYMLPEEGYVKSITIPHEYTKNAFAKKHHVFIRTDSPNAYMRMDYSVQSENGRLAVHADFAINPYGERLLESAVPFHDENDESTLNIFAIGAHQRKFDKGYEIYQPIRERAREEWMKRKLIQKPDISIPLKKGYLIFEDLRNN